MTYGRVQINRKVANPVHGQLNREKFPCPRLRRKIWFRETGLAVSSRVSLLILYTNAESGIYSRGSSQCPQRCPYIFTPIHHRVSHDFIGSRICVPMRFTAESPLCQNTITAVLLLYILWTHFPPPTYVCTSVTSVVYTVQYHKLCSKHTGSYYCCTVDPFSPSGDLCLRNKCKK